MRITVTPIRMPEAEFSLIDGSWLNTYPLRGETIGLERDGLDGWKNGVEPRYESPEILGRDGNYAPDEISLSSRLLTIRGFFDARPPASSLAAAAFEDRLASMVGEWLRVTVEDAAGVRHVEGFVSAIPINTRLSERRLKFTLIISCPDPLKYGRMVTYPVTAGTATVENLGTGHVFPRFDVTGRVTFLDIKVPGHHVRWVGSADGLALDFRDAFPLSGGFEVGSLVWAEVFRLPPGKTAITVQTDGRLSIGVASGWK